MEKTNKKRRKKLNLFRLALIILFLMVVATCTIACSYIYKSVADMPAFDPADIHFAASTDIYDKNDQLVARVGIQNRVPVDIEQVPKMVQEAFLAIEDHRFHQHMGIDIYRIFGAAWANIKAESLRQGGSTITQQLVRRATDIGTERTFERKIQEMILAIQMERHFTKNEILEHYLNGIYFGAGAHGIQAAAHIYFNKDVSELSLAEAAVLAGLPQAPSAYNPLRNIEAAENRRNIVLNQMAVHGYITKTQASEAQAKKIVLNPGKLTAKDYPYPYFIDYVIETLIDQYGETKVFKGGLKVYTTLDPNIQQAAEIALGNENNFPGSTKDQHGNWQPNSAAVVLNPHTGHIKALVGGREHLTQRGWNRATDEKRRPGSAFKPIIAYGPAIEFLGQAPATIFDDIPLTVGKYSPRNFDHAYRGLITMRHAMRLSVNIPAVKALRTVGMNQAVAFAAGLGFEQNQEQIKIAGLAAALGGLDKGVTPLQMAAAFGAFANNGIYTEPIIIRRVERLDGTLLEEITPKQHRAMKPTTAYLITDMLQSAVTGGTGTAARMNRPVAGKTGTAENKDGRTSDTWFVGYTADLVGATWIGNKNQNKPLPRNYFGGTHTARLWQEIMVVAHEGLPVRDFSRPPEIVSATVDSKSGLLPGPYTPPEHLVTDLFARGTVPTKTDNVHVLMEVCGTTGKLSGEYCQNRVPKVFIKLPYTVSAKVADFHLRAPTEMCATCIAVEHDEWLPIAPDLPDFPHFNPDPWDMPWNIPPEQPAEEQITTN